MTRPFCFLLVADLSKNRFAELPEEVTEFLFLEKLHLYHNAIRTIPETVVMLQSLNYLDLRSVRTGSGVAWFTAWCGLRINLERRRFCSQSQPIDFSTSGDMQATAANLVGRSQQIGISAGRIGQDVGVGRARCGMQRNHESATPHGRSCAT